MRYLLKILLKGLVVIVPMAVTLYVLWWLGSSAEEILGPPLRAVLPKEGILKYRTGMGLVLGVVVTFFVGLLTYTLVFRTLLKWTDRLLAKVPLVKSLYRGLRDLMDLMSQTGDMKKMNQVVAVRMGDNLRILGFVTQGKSEQIPEPLSGEESRVAVYLPMSYQLGGYTVFVERERLEQLDMSVEDGMRYALTAAMSSRKADGQGAGVMGTESDEPETSDDADADRNSDTQEGTDQARRPQ